MVLGQKNVLIVINARICVICMYMYIYICNVYVYVVINDVFNPSILCSIYIVV